MTQYDFELFFIAGKEGNTYRISGNDDVLYNAVVNPSNIIQEKSYCIEVTLDEAEKIKAQEPITYEVEV